jgi:hypothetical protein
VNVPAFGECGVHLDKKDTRILIAMTGVQGIHFQIHDVASGEHMLTRATLLMWATDRTASCRMDGQMMFFGDGISLRNRDGDWISYGGAALPHPP